MLLIVILVEIMLCAWMAVAVLLDDKKLRADFDVWAGKTKKFVYRIPLKLVVREEIKAVADEVKHVARHRYVNP